MVIWGGHDSASFLNTGGRYDPSTDTWQPITTVGAPTARQLPSALWTGSKVILWGGAPQASIGDTIGGRYDPVADTWAPISTAMPARIVHSAVWTGSLMIIWGGHPTNGGAEFDNGGRYDPIANTWSPVSTLGGPGQRPGHTGIWTGDRMIIWGGGFLNTGGIYDPVSDSWTQTGTQNAPKGKRYHSAVWADDRMIVWGGQEGVPLVWSTGAVYGGMTLRNYYHDFDADGFGDPGDSLAACDPPLGFVAVAGDCNDADADAWGLPTEVLQLQWADPATLSWSAPQNYGSNHIGYDVLRSTNPADFVSGGTCVATNLPSPSLIDPSLPSVSEAFSFLVRARNGCPSGAGPLGTASNGTPRAGLDCP
jgi:hypothetical protein